MFYVDSARRCYESSGLLGNILKSAKMCCAISSARIVIRLLLAYASTLLP